MTHAPALEEVETRLRSLGSSGLVTAEDARAIGQLDVFRLPAFSDAGSPTALKRSASRRLRAVSKAAALAAALMLVVLANVGAAYFAPRYGRALADVPGVGPVSDRMLQFLGLNDGKVTVVNAATSSSGHTVRLVAGYADGVRTVLLVDVDGKGLTGNPKAFGTNPGDYGVSVEAVSLSDQFGHNYGLARGDQTAVALTFEPLVWPASAVGARLALHVGAIQAEWVTGPGTDTVLKGDWNLHATLHAPSSRPRADTRGRIHIYVSPSVRNNRDRALVGHGDRARRSEQTVAAANQPAIGTGRRVRPTDAELFLAEALRFRREADDHVGVGLRVPEGPAGSGGHDRFRARPWPVSHRVR